MRTRDGRFVHLCLPILLLAVGVRVESWGASACPDADADGYADCTIPGCDPAGVTCGDCDDAAGGTYPGAPESCNHRDDDCDGLPDDGFTLQTARQVVADAHPGAYDLYGASLAALGDVTGDGVPDFVVGNPGDDIGAWDGGSVTLHSGADFSVVCRVAGATFDGLGALVVALPDMNGDGRADFATAAPGHDFVVLFSGADCTQVALCTDSGTTNLGGDHGLAGWVDVTGDGIPEILAGADRTNSPLHHGGRAVVFSPSADGSCTVLRALSDPELTIYAHFGYAVAGIADVTGDGVSDIAVGEPGHDNSAGCVLIFSGADGALIRRILDPTNVSTDRLGEALAPIADLDGDGRPELVVGSPRKNAPGASDAGHVIVFSPEDGAVVRDMLDSGGTGGWLGWSVATLPDMNGDGLADIAAGARYGDVYGAANAGKVVVLSGADGAKIVEYTAADGAAGDQLGYCVAHAGDPSGDGMAEILAGAPYRDGAALDVGRAAIFARETDCDGDGPGPFAGDCDDADGTVWSLPGGVRNLSLAADRRTLAWDAPLNSGNASGALLYDLLRADSAAAFEAAECLAVDTAERTADDPALPAAGGGYYYAARAQNACGEGRAGKDSAGRPRPAPTCP